MKSRLDALDKALLTPNWIDLASQVEGVLALAHGGTGSPTALTGSANLILATPNGSPGDASLRAMVVKDLPNPLDIGTF